MHQSVKLTDLICLLQLVISSPLIHALGDLSRDSNPGRQIERCMTYQLSYPSPLNPVTVNVDTFQTQTVNSEW